MDCVDVHGIPRHLSQAASPPAPEEYEAQHWHAASLLFSWKERAKRNLWMAASGTQLFIFPSVTLSISLFFFFFNFFWTVSFIPAGKDQNITVGYARKKAPLWRKKPYRNRVASLSSAKLNTGGVSACICIQNMHTHVHVCTDAT